jgi:hypothetical protein
MKGKYRAVEVPAGPREFKPGNEHMKLTKLSLTFLTFTAAVLLISGMLLRGAAQTTPSDHNSSAGSDDSTQVKIARAMSAGPSEVAKAFHAVVC